MGLTPRVVPDTQDLILHLSAGQTALLTRTVVGVWRLIIISADGLTRVDHGLFATTFDAIALLETTERIRAAS